jgi:hypothetical protein
MATFATATDQENPDDNPKISPQFSSDTDITTNNQLLNRLINDHSWILDVDGMGLSKTYWFKTYTKCLVS